MDSKLDELVSVSESVRQYGLKIGHTEIFSSEYWYNGLTNYVKIIAAYHGDRCSSSGLYHLLVRSSMKITLRLIIPL